MDRVLIAPRARVSEELPTGRGCGELRRRFSSATNGTPMRLAEHGGGRGALPYGSGQRSPPRRGRRWQTNPEHPGAHAVLARVAMIEGRRDEARSRVVDHVLKRQSSPRAGPRRARRSRRGRDPRSQSEYREAGEMPSPELTTRPERRVLHDASPTIFSFLHLYPEVAEITGEGVATHARRPIRTGRSRSQPHAPAAACEMEGLAGDPAGSTRKTRWNERTTNTLDFYERRIVDDGGITPPTSTTARRNSPCAYPPRGQRARRRPVSSWRPIARARPSTRATASIPGKLRLEIYESPEEFSLRTVGVPSLGAVGVCFGKRHHDARPLPGDPQLSTKSSGTSSHTSTPYSSQQGPGPTLVHRGALGMGE